MATTRHDGTQWVWDDPLNGRRVVSRSLETTEREVAQRMAGFQGQRGFTPHAMVQDEVQDWWPASNPFATAGLSLTQQQQLQTVRLSCELVPRPCWWANLRKYLPAADWRTCQEFVRSRAQGCCEICGGRASRELDCHEIWAYDDENHVQMLVGLIGLCQLCHGVKHLGFQSTKGQENVARHLEHMTRVNDWDYDTTEFYVREAFVRHAIRSDFAWTQNLEWLPLALGIEVDLTHQPRSLRKI